MTLPHGVSRGREVALALAVAFAFALSGCAGSTRPPAVQATATLAAAATPSEPILTPAPAGPATATGSGAPGVVPEAGSQTGPALALSTLQMVSATSGWATGWTVDRSRGGVLRTSDGGAEWQIISPRDVDPTRIENSFFLDGTHAWLAVSAGREATAHPISTTLNFLRTVDGGATWQSIAPLHFLSSGPGWLDFIDPQHGWYMANLSQAAGSMAVELYQTTDGGLHWASVSVTAGEPSLSTPGSLPVECNKTGIAFADAETGWATGHCTTGGVFFYVTRDGGRTWRSQSLRPPADAPSDLFATCDCETTPPVFATARDGITPVKIFVSEHEAVLYVTKDGGQTWQPSQLASNRLLRPPVFVSPNDGWVTDEVDLFVTHDGGLTWTTAGHLPDLRLLGTFDFVDLKNGWLTGGVQVYATHDGGVTWQPITPVLAPGAP